jgi:alkylated DNA repair dioxygenase AlkB
MENAWRAMLLYAADADENGSPTVAHARRLCELTESGAAETPEARGAEPLCAIWRNRRLGAAEARLLIYIPLCVEALCRDPAAREAYRILRARAARSGSCPSSGVSLEEAVAALGWEMEPGPVVAALLGDRLLEAVYDAAAAAGLEAPAPRDLPPDLSPLKEAETLPGLIGGAVVYHRTVFLNRLADRYFELFRPGGAAEIPWERRTIMMFGRPCKEAHDTAYFGDLGTTYRYSGADHTPLPWTADPTGALAELLALVRLVTGRPFNFVLMNLYTPKDSIGVHSDDERDLVEGSPIFSISLGRARRFHLEAKGGSGARGRPVSLLLAHGSALVMAGFTQKAYKHSVPPETPRDRALAGRSPAARVNLTFRCVRRGRY